MREIEQGRFQPSVDVAIPCYQYGRFLRDCVESVLSQGIRDLRILIIDNASTDNSVEVARQLANEDRRVEVVVHRRNLGQHASFNEAIDWARSDYFLVLCADDLVAPGSLIRATSIMEQEPDVHLTYGRALVIPIDAPLPDIGKYNKDTTWRVLRGQRLFEHFCDTGRNHISGPTAVVRTAAQKHVGYCRSELMHTDDFELWMRFTQVGDAAETDAVQGIQRCHPSNQCATVSNIHEWNLHFEAAFESFFSHEGGCIAGSQQLRQLARRSLAERAYWCSFSALCRGEVGVGRDLLQFAFRLRPILAILPPLRYLFRREDTLHRIVSLAGETLGRVHGFGTARARSLMRCILRVCAAYIPGDF